MGNRKSDHCVVLMKPGNAGGGKAMTQWSPYRGNIYHTGGGNQMETELVRIAKTRNMAVLDTNLSTY